MARIALSALQQRNYLTGTGRHIAGLFGALGEIPAGDREFLLYVKPDQQELYKSDGTVARLKVLKECPSVPWKRALWELRHFTGQLRRDQIDLYHGPANFLPPRKICPCVLTLHDMVYFHNPERTTWARAKYWQWMIRRTWRQADRIITVSEFSRDQIMKYLPVPGNLVEVIPNGVEERFFEMATAEERQTMRRELGLDDPYILYVGRLDPDKNVTRIVEAFARLCEKGETTHRLVIAGAKEYRESETHAMVEKHRLTDRVMFTGYVKEEHLLPLYQECAVFCFPSLNEGFGLPVLEAMASGVPVVTSNISSLPEVAGDAGIVVDPFSVEEIAAGISEVLGTNRGRELAEAGQARARTFTWKSAAEKHLDVYNDVLSRA